MVRQPTPPGREFDNDDSDLDLDDEPNLNTLDDFNEDDEMPDPDPDASGDISLLDDVGDSDDDDDDAEFPDEADDGDDEELSFSERLLIEMLDEAQTIRQLLMALVMATPNGKFYLAQIQKQDKEKAEAEALLEGDEDD